MNFQKWSHQSIVGNQRQIRAIILVILSKYNHFNNILTDIIYSYFSGNILSKQRTMFRVFCNARSILFPAKKYFSSVPQISSFSRSKQSRLSSESLRDVLQRCCYHTRTEIKKIQKVNNRNSMYYLTAFTIFVGGCTYSSVLLYRLYCQVCNY